MNVMNETELNAKFAALCKQRENSQNETVNLYGALAMAQERIKDLESQLGAQMDRATELDERIVDLEQQLNNAKDQLDCQSPYMQFGGQCTDIDTSSTEVTNA